MAAPQASTTTGKEDLQILWTQLDRLNIKLHKGRIEHCINSITKLLTELELVPPKSAREKDIVDRLVKLNEEANQILLDERLCNLAKVAF